MQAVSPTKKHSAYTASIIILVFGALNYFLQYAFNALIAKHMNPSLYGDFNVAINILSILGVFSVFGVQTVEMQFLPKYLLKLEDKSILQDFMSWILQLTQFGLLVCAVLAILLGIVLYILKHHYHIDPHELHLSVYMLWVAPFLAFSILVQRVILSNNHPITSYILSNNCVSLFQLIVFGVAILAFGLYMHKVTIIFLLILSYLLVTAVSAIILMIQSRSLFSEFFSRLRTRPKQISPIWIASLKKALPSSMVYALNGVIDLIILKIFGGHGAEVGLYSAVWVICAVIWLIPQTIYTLAMAKVSVYTDKNSQLPFEHFQMFIDKINLVTFGLLLLITGIIVIWGKSLLLLFGPQYIEAYPILLICASTSFLGSLAVGPSEIVTYSNHLIAMLVLNVTQLLIIMGVGIPTTHYYGMYGISWSYFVSQVIVTAMTLIYVRRTIHLRTLIFV